MKLHSLIQIIGIGASSIYIITDDANQGYHQISVLSLDREKLALFDPRNRKYTFKVMPFGPTNVPEFYTCMMRDLRGERHILFIIYFRSMEKIGGQKVVVTEMDDILVGGIKVHSGSNGIIDDILIW